MTDQHPITPPPELVEEWAHMLEYLPDKQVFSLAAQWGANQELEACEQAIIDQKWFADPEFRLAELHNARRPKPPSLKEQALEVVTGLEKRCDLQCDLALIRRALESQP